MCNEYDECGEIETESAIAEEISTAHNEYGECGEIETGVIAPHITNCIRNEYDECGEIETAYGPVSYSKTSDGYRAESHVYLTTAAAPTLEECMQEIEDEAYSDDLTNLMLWNAR
ncbi:hypothetical protein FACS1894204_02840 [Synergistales bacterium]|nr:hypothetical protein FACS1894204_02840 [Synergistales bacterium]